MFRNFLYRISALLLTVAPIMALGIKCTFFAGEPNLPSKMKKQ